MQSQSSRPPLSRPVAPRCPPPAPGEPQCGAQRGCCRARTAPTSRPPLRMTRGQVSHSGSIHLLWPHSQVGQAVLGAPVQAPEVPSLMGSPLPGAATSPGLPGTNYPNGLGLARGGRYSLIQFTLKCNLIFRQAGGQPPAHPATFPPLHALPCSLSLLGTGKSLSLHRHPFSGHKITGGSLSAD